MTAFAGIVAGIVLLIGGGTALVHGASQEAARLGISPLIVGLTIVAMGTSLPELVVNAVGAIRGETELVFDNVVGSNIFNAMLVLPVTGLIENVAIPEGGVVDLLFSWLLALVLVPLFYVGKASIGRIAGASLLSSYVAWAVLRLTES